MGLAVTVLYFAFTSVACAGALDAPSEAVYTEQDVRKMAETAEGVLAPVYAPLADQIVSDFDLAEVSGIGIDLGSGPGDLIIELCKRTRLHWVNADINTHFFQRFYEKAGAAGMGHRVSAMFADAQALPFRDGYATVIVSRGSFFFWRDKVRAFSEIYRVLKPGGVAYVGRGFPRNLPASVAQTVRASQKKPAGDEPVKYDVRETEKELRQALDAAGITDYEIERPGCPDPGVKINYGIWVTIRKPK